jgi:hypothetical protein
MLYTLPESESFIKLSNTYLGALKCITRFLYSGLRKVEAETMTIIDQETRFS